MKLGFSGYGGKYCIGKLTDIEVTNITELLARFDERLFLSSPETIFDTHDFKVEYFDFDDIFECESISIPCDITIDELPIDYKLNLNDLFTSDDIDVVDIATPPLQDGFYLTSTASQKGNFFNIDIDVLPEDFDQTLMHIHVVDLDGYSMSDIVIQEISYNGKLVEFNTDSYYTDDCSFSQSILYVEDGIHYDGIEVLRERIDTDYKIITTTTIGELDSNEFIVQYLEFVEAKNNGYLLDKGYILSFASPMLYENYDKDEIDLLWMTEENIKFILSHNLMDTMPTDVYDRIIGRFPEWMI